MSHALVGLKVLCHGLFSHIEIVGQDLMVCCWYAFSQLEPHVLALQRHECGIDIKNA